MSVFTPPAGSTGPRSLCSRLARAACRAVLPSALAALVFAGPAQAQPVAQAAGPRLYVMVSVDQLRADYVQRYGHMWTRGLRRLVDGGAYFPLSAYPYMNTITCAGHATIGTGTLPATHGMVLNQWWDRDLARLTACTDDETQKPLHVTGQPPTAAVGNSARRLLAPTFADELRAQSAVAPRIASLSLKARSAIGMVGRRGDLVLWFDAEHGWTTSTAYTDRVPAWVATHVAAHASDRDYGRQWTKLLPATAYAWEDDAIGEGMPNNWARTFPHDLTSPSGAPDRQFRGKWQDTPFADAALTALARAAVDELALGRDPARRDVLAVSYSVLDHVGHAYGPRSHEVQDVLARLDVTLGDLLDHLDARVGRQRYVLALTGDHGVSPIPDQMSALGLDAGRIASVRLREALDKALEPHLGPGPNLAAAAYTDLYFAPGKYAALQANPAAMAAAIAALEAVPGVARVYRREELREAAAAGDAMARAVAAGFHPARSGDLLLVPRAYWITSGAIATHGTAYDYDARVPLLFYGAGVKPGTYAGASSPADIAPTFAHLAGITLPRSDGRVHVEAFGAPVAAPAPPRRPAPASLAPARPQAP